MTKKQSAASDPREDLRIEYVDISTLKESEYNPRVWSDDAKKQLKESLKRFGCVDPLILNSAPGRENVVIGGNFRLFTLKELGFKTVPAVYIHIADIEKEKELNIRLNKNTGAFDWDLLKNFSEDFLDDIGFTSQELDNIFDFGDEPEEFDLAKELKKIGIEDIEMEKGSIWELGEHRLLVGDSTVESDMLKLMNGEKVTFCCTDPPYILDYLSGKQKHGKATTGFGYKRDRRYLETDVLPDDFTEKWMANVHKVQHEDFNILVYENWKNLRIIWGEMEKYWKVKNMIVWHLENRHQNFAAKHKFFSKHDIAMVGSSPDKAVDFNLEQEEDALQNEYETALFAISGDPHWESYQKNKKLCPTDFIEFRASDEKHSGQGIVFGTKPIEILIPYMKVLSKRDDIVLEPFGGSGSTLITAEKLKRRCRIMEKSPVYAEVIRKRWEKLTGLKAKKLA
ncbi:MAG: DNA modification methylase [Candidatus Moranbacteria bacterium]|nr:DNA modification methylase [Candidatus Moranbacteria bacterium]